MMDKVSTYERYQRQIILPEFAMEGQEKLMHARVLMIGAGGLGCPVLQYLTAAGTGTIGIIDDDVVALNNLHRQVIYSVDDIGFSKAESAARILSRLNPEINILPYNKRLTTENAFELLSDFDIIIDGTDNFSTRYLINDACVLLKKPLVYGAISRFEGQVSVFNYPINGNNATVNYRDIFPHPPKEDEVLNCADSGVLGVLPGIIGSMLANEVIKMIVGFGEVLSGRLVTYNALNNQAYHLIISPAVNTRSLIPKDQDEFLKTDYEWLCSSTVNGMEIDAVTFRYLLQSQKPDIIDVRDVHETPAITKFPTIKIPLAQLTKNENKLLSDTVVVICQTGKRSLQAAKVLNGIFGGTKKVYSLKGGIVGWELQNLET